MFIVSYSKTELLHFAGGLPTKLQISKTCTYDQVGNCQHIKLETYRIEVLTMVFVILIMLAFSLVIPGEDLSYKILQGIVLEKFLQLAFALICIKRSEKIFPFFKNQIFTWFCCRPYTNGGINADLNVGSHTQWQDTYLTDSLDQNVNEDDLDPDQGVARETTGSEFALHRIS